jgi:hypothetical protein
MTFIAIIKNFSLRAASKSLKARIRMLAEESVIDRGLG